MALSKSDQEYIQNVHNAGIEHIKEILTLTTDNIKSELNFIKEQTTKTNGRVTRLEEKESNHSTNCPVKEQVGILWEDRAVHKGVSKWQLAFLIVASSVLGSVATGIAIFQFILKANP